MPVDLRHLRAFVAVAEELHFARAAARLGLEQSPLSRQIQDLEATLGLRLFQRNSRRTALTPLGERFLIDARRILYDTQASIAALQRLAEGQGAPFRLGLAEGIAGDRFSRFLRAAAGVSPPISIVLVEQRQADLVALVARGGLEAAIVFDDRLVEGLNCELAWSSPLVLGVALDHRLAKHRVTNLKDAREETWILPDPSVLPGYAWQVATTLARFQIRPERPLYAAHQTSMMRLVASGAGVALMGGSLVAGLDGFARLDLREPSRLTAWLVWRADDCRGAADQCCKGSARELFDGPWPAAQREAVRRPLRRGRSRRGIGVGFGLSLNLRTDLRLGWGRDLRHGGHLAFAPSVRSMRTTD